MSALIPTFAYCTTRGGTPIPNPGSAPAAGFIIGGKGGPPRGPYVITNNGVPLITGKTYNDSGEFIETFINPPPGSYTLELRENLSLLPTHTWVLTVAKDFVVKFLNEPYRIGPGGQLPDIRLILAQNGQPFAGIITITLPTGTTFSDGTSGPRSFTTQSDGTLTISGVRGGITPGAFTLTAIHASDMATASLTIHAHGPVGAIAAGGQPLAVVMSPDGTRVYVSDGTSSLVSVIETASSRVVGQINASGPLAAWDLVTDSQGSRLYVCKGDSMAGVNGAIAELDPNTLTLIRNVQVPGYPIGLALAADGKRLFSSDWHGNTVNVLDTLTFQTVTTLTVGSNPRGLAVTPDSSRVFVCNFDNLTSTGSISMIDARTLTVVRTIPVQGSPYDAVATPDGRFIYAGVWVDQPQFKGAIVQLNALDGSVIKTMPVGGLPRGICVNPSGTLVHYCHGNVHSVATIDPASGALIRYTGVGSEGYDTALSHDGIRAYVPCPLTNTVQVIPLDSGPAISGSVGGLGVPAVAFTPRPPIYGDPL